MNEYKFTWISFSYISINTGNSAELANVRSQVVYSWVIKGVTWNDCA